MKPIHRKIQKSQASFVKKLARQILPLGKYFNAKQKAELNKFYTTRLITANQAKVEVLQMKDSKLLKLFFRLISDESVRTNPWGNAFNEKIQMILFVCNNGVQFEHFRKEVHEFYASNEQFKAS